MSSKEWETPLGNMAYIKIILKSVSPRLIVNPLHVPAGGYSLVPVLKQLSDATQKSGPQVRFIYIIMASSIETFLGVYRCTIIGKKDIS
jgi:hypothetical protein